MQKPLPMARTVASSFILPMMATSLVCAAAWGEIAPPLEIVRDPGPGVIALTGPWQFHPRDDPPFAAPSLDDSTGHEGWEQIAVDAPWGTQGHSAAMAKCPPHPSWGYDDPAFTNVNPTGSASIRRARACLPCASGFGPYGPMTTACKVGSMLRLSSPLRRSPASPLR